MLQTHSSERARGKKNKPPGCVKGPPGAPGPRRAPQRLGRGHRSGSAAPPEPAGDGGGGAAGANTDCSGSFTRHPMQTFDPKRRVSAALRINPTLLKPHRPRSPFLLCRGGDGAASPGGDHGADPPPEAQREVPGPGQPQEHPRHPVPAPHSPPSTGKLRGRREAGAVWENFGRAVAAVPPRAFGRTGAAGFEARRPRADEAGPQPLPWTAPPADPFPRHCGSPGRGDRRIRSSDRARGFSVPSHGLPQRPISKHPTASHGPVAPRPVASHNVPSHSIQWHPVASRGIPSRGILTHGIPQHPVAPRHPVPRSRGISRSRNIPRHPFPRHPPASRPAAPPPAAPPPKTPLSIPSRGTPSRGTPQHPVPRHPLPRHPPASRPAAPPPKKPPSIPSRGTPSQDTPQHPVPRHPRIPQRPVAPRRPPRPHLLPARGRPAVSPPATPERRAPIAADCAPLAARANCSRLPAEPPPRKRSQAPPIFCLLGVTTPAGVSNREKRRPRGRSGAGFQQVEMNMNSSSRRGGGAGGGARRCQPAPSPLPARSQPAPSPLPALCRDCRRLPSPLWQPEVFVKRPLPSRRGHLL
ncbi:basic proline-rich protein-like [Cuculus canorus]|uniref:basic proline-rich protein-like n=1 Tax=Cuculus canorus TaxID=55661 RepID=UPI0023AB522F|nr:basic proline-rich protein-like [Cuculus canorus]